MPEGPEIRREADQIEEAVGGKETGERPETNRQLRLVVETKDKAALLYSASVIDVLDADELGDHPYLSKLGPDPLDDDVEPSDFAERLLSDDFRRRQLASVLLDQSFGAGLGNYLRAEILFEVGIYPKRRAADLDDEMIDALAQAIIDVTRRAYETGGVPNDPQRVEMLTAEGREREEVRFAVYKREGEPCFRCGTEIERMSAGGRRIFYCPECQPENG